MRERGEEGGREGNAVRCFVVDGSKNADPNLRLVRIKYTCARANIGINRKTADLIFTSVHFMTHHRIFKFSNDPARTEGALHRRGFLRWRVRIQIEKHTHTYIYINSKIVRIRETV